MRDSDDPTASNKLDLPADNLPDDFEITTTKTHTGTVDSCRLSTHISTTYALYGDEEFYVSMYSNGLRGDAAKDWANPGKQAGDQPATLQAAVGTDTFGGPVTTGAIPAQVPVAPGFATLTGAYADTGVDTDGDGAYDYLRLDVGLEIAEPELYNVVAWLSDPGGDELVWAAHQQSLAPGAHTVQLAVDGTLLHRSGQDGPYTLQRVEVRAGDRELLADAADDAGATAAYAYTDFDPPDIAFTGTYDETTVDTNDNGLADILRIQVGVDVQRAGNYTLIGELDAGFPLVATRTVVDLTPGIRTVALDFNGSSLFQNRVDGPYTLARLRLLDDAGALVVGGGDAYATDTYLHTAFEHTGTTIDATSYMSGLADDDEDGRYEALRLLFLMDVDPAGDYWISADLYDADQRVIAQAGKTETLYRGTALVVLDFSTTDIAQHGVDGPYTIQHVTLVDETGAVVDVHPVAHTTEAYGYRLFADPEFLFLPAVRR